MICRLCHSPDLSTVPFPIPESAGRWFRCAACGSHSNSLDYNPALYPPDLAEQMTANGSGIDRLREQCRSNCDWFGHYTEGLPNRDFLDVGCCDGAALDVMTSLGWSVHGFDVVRPPYFGPHVTVAPHFTRWLFPLRYAAVLCREVFEHVPSPDLLLHELHGVTCPEGLVQIQTPIPLGRFDEKVYQAGHLHLASPGQMRTMMNGAMLDVLDAREWDTGQAYLCRARR